MKCVCGREVMKLGDLVAKLEKILNERSLIDGMPKVSFDFCGAGISILERRDYMHITCEGGAAKAKYVHDMLVYWKRHYGYITDNTRLMVSKHDLDYAGTGTAIVGLYEKADGNLLLLTSHYPRR